VITPRSRVVVHRLVWLGTVVPLLCAAADVAAQPAAASPAPPTAAPTAGLPAKSFELKTLDGDPVRLESFRGKPLVVNFFASWCDPCRDEMPLLNTLAGEAPRRGYHVLGIAVQDGRAAVMQYAKEGPVSFPIALDLNNTVQRAYWVFGPPVTFFIDAQGMIRDKVVGRLSPERAREALEKARVRP
jgi:peroxiredoxin